MTAVAHVIFNRVGAPGFANTLHEVIYGKNQFSSMSISTDPEYNLAAPEPTDPDYPSYCTAMSIVNAIAAGTESDPTGGALYYANLAECTSGWFFHHIVNDPANHPLRATLGHQVFYA
jgi:spore germination cell wall hydrolase CwlJ-like protein